MRTPSRFYFSVLSLWAVLFLALGPTLGTVLSASTGQFIQICTLYGIQNIEVSEDLTPIAPHDKGDDSHAKAQQHCVFCQSREFAALLLPVQTLDILRPALSETQLFFTFVLSVQTPLERGAFYNSRAPPVDVI